MCKFLHQSSPLKFPNLQSVIDSLVKWLEFILKELKSFLFIHSVRVQILILFSARCKSQSHKTSPWASSLGEGELFSLPHPQKACSQAIIKLDWKLPLSFINYHTVRFVLIWYDTFSALTAFSASIVLIGRVQTWWPTWENSSLWFYDKLVAAQW